MKSPFLIHTVEMGNVFQIRKVMQYLKSFIKSIFEANAPNSLHLQYDNQYNKVHISEARINPLQNVLN